jgi:ribosomal protein S18 acetylase RimI-like enzyme
MGVQIRRATTADACEVLKLWRQADAHPTHTDDVESIDRLIAHDPEALLVAVDDGANVVGSVIATWDGWRGSIYRLVVAPGHRRRGLGRQLLRAGEDRLRNKHAVRLQAIVVETDVNACAFWRSSGWEEQVERIRFVKG